MTRLFRVEEDGSYNEVETNDRLAGLGDAITIAQSTGDGQYWYDYQNGTYHVMSVTEGRVQELGSDAVQQGEPGADYDRSRMAETVSSSVSRFGTVLPTDGVVGHPHDTRPAVEEF